MALKDLCIVLSLVSFRVITKSAPVFALAVATIFIYFGLPRTAPADLISVDWDNSDSTADGLINGNLGSVNVSVNNQTGRLHPPADNFLQPTGRPT